MAPFLVVFLAVDAVITLGVCLFVLRLRKRNAGKAVAAPAAPRATTAPAAARATSAPASAGTAGTGRPAIQGVVRTAPVAVPAPPSTGTPGPGRADPPAGGAGETGALTRMFGRGELRVLAAFAAEQNERICGYVRGNWSGAPGDLPAVLGSLLTELDRDALAKGLELDPQTLKTMVMTALRSQRIGSGGEVRAALDQAA